MSRSSEGKNVYREYRTSTLTYKRRSGYVRHALEAIKGMERAKGKKKSVRQRLARVEYVLNTKRHLRKIHALS